MTWGDWAQVADRPYPGSPAFAHPAALTGGKAPWWPGSGRVSLPAGRTRPGGAKSEGTPEDMCGVVGLRLKDPALYPVLGELVVPMLDVLASRGPDSTGVAIYRHDASPGALKYSLSAQAADHDWGGYLAALEARAGGVP